MTSADEPERGEPERGGGGLDVGVLRRRLLAVVAAISALGLAVELWHARSHDPVIEVLLPRLSLSYEHNVPTWLASSLLLACALAAGAIARGAASWRRHWWGVTGVFGYASLDEAIQLHEHLGGHLEAGGVLYFDWVIPAAAILAVLAVVFLPFVRALPAVTRRRLVIAGAIFLGGAVAMELPLGWWTERAGTDSLGYGVIDWIEETLELVGSSLALVALVAHRQEAVAS
ncbi:MAG TPA: hypothetical protein VK932_23320 [Kofleriaceae bacterium]|nr:hypothetical protein [Kofleriaceae bacterium]